MWTLLMRWLRGVPRWYTNPFFFLGVEYRFYYQTFIHGLKALQTTFSFRHEQSF